MQWRTEFSVEAHAFFGTFSAYMSPSSPGQSTSSLGLPFIFFHPVLIIRGSLCVWCERWPSLILPEALSILLLIG